MRSTWSSRHFSTRKSCRSRLPSKAAFSMRYVPIWQRGEGRLPLTLCVQSALRVQEQKSSIVSSRIWRRSSKAKCTEGEPVIRHFTDQSRGIPIWALMETLTLGEFSAIYSCLTDELKDAIYDRLGMPRRIRSRYAQKKDKTDLLLALLRVLASLRNSVAHNNVILDARFLIRNTPNKHVREYLGQEFGIDPVPSPRSPTACCWSSSLPLP